MAAKKEEMMVSEWARCWVVGTVGCLAEKSEHGMERMSDDQMAE